MATYVLLVGILLNAIICGGFSTVNNRFEARVVWLIQLSAFAGICVMRPHWKGRETVQGGTGLMDSRASHEVSRQI